MRQQQYAQYMQNQALMQANLEKEYASSFQGKTTHSLKWYFLYVLLPIWVVVGCIEDFTNMQSPRRNLYKNKLRIPDLKDYLMFEIVQCARSQDQTPDAKKAERKAKMQAKKEGKLL